VRSPCWPTASSPGSTTCRRSPAPAGGQQVNGAELAAQLREIRAAHLGADVLAVLERVSAMPGQGVSSMFRFGEGYGVVQGVLAALGIPVIAGSPAVWKRASGLIGRDKDVARNAGDPADHPTAQ